MSFSTRTLCGAALLLGLTGCAVTWDAPVKPPPGVIYSRVKAPLTYDFHGQPAGTANTKQAAKNTRYFAVPFFNGINVAWDSADIESIARSGGIKTVSHADYEYFTVLGLYAEFTVRVFGN